MIRIGYVGINTALPTASKTFRIRNYTEVRMLEYAGSNILALEQILHWNLDHDILLFRITSGLIPYGSSPINSGVWKDKFASDLDRIGNFIKKNNMRVSMHPGQYTVLNTPNEQYFRNSLAEILYHNEILSLLNLDNANHIVLHGGGAYGDKTNSIKLLKKRFNDLPKNIRARITLENDDRTFTAEDIFNICQDLRVPATFDVFHHQTLPSMTKYDIKKIIDLYNATWKNERQKIHYSNQEPGKKRGAHSETINMKEFDRFYQLIREMDLDVMLEVNDKQESVLKIRSKYKEIL